MVQGPHQSLTTLDIIKKSNQKISAGKSIYIQGGMTYDSTTQHYINER